MQCLRSLHYFLLIFLFFPLPLFKHYVNSNFLKSVPFCSLIIIILCPESIHILHSMHPKLNMLLGMWDNLPLVSILFEIPKNYPLLFWSQQIQALKTGMAVKTNNFICFCRLCNIALNLIFHVFLQKAHEHIY